MPVNQSLLKESENISNYLKTLKNKTRKNNIIEHKKETIYDKNFFINEEMNNLISELNLFTEEKIDNDLENIITETE